MGSRFQKPVGVAMKENDRRVARCRGVIPPFQWEAVVGHHGKLDVGAAGIAGAWGGVIRLGMKDQMALIDIETCQTQNVNRDRGHGDPAGYPGEACHGAAMENGMIREPLQCRSGASRCRPIPVNIMALMTMMIGAKRTAAALRR